MSWVCPGYYLFPMMGGYNIAPTNQIFTGHQNTKFKLNKYLIYTVIATCHTFPFVTAFCLLNSGLSTDQMAVLVQRNWPKCIHVLNNRGFVIYDPSGNEWSAAVGLAAMAYISVFSVFGAFLGVHTMYILQKVRFHLSRQTYSIHKTAMINLALQCLVPTFFVIIPFNIIFLVVLNDWWQWQEFSTNLLFVMAAHSMVSSAILILSNRRFKNLIAEKILIIPQRLIDTFQPYSIPVDITSYRIAPTATSMSPI
ncbi:hypothetical protein GCK72_003500 [Caenorhabditis remanei]|uniref:Uncharacterized protein n=1 Tax=Caenorhabditis remanei TaxID=31234 RepID=A0A6A5HYC5_CAERE|nr:hypothetical protein GCK72_003500 [Caenorhabditis remanei]KAF1771673.1 hypothetical protein GCK72_003500 [Caenorhabditis remanei]